MGRGGREKPSIAGRLREARDRSAHEPGRSHAPPQAAKTTLFAADLRGTLPEKSLPAIFPNKGEELACKPGSVEGDHSSGTHVTVSLERPTRKRGRIPLETPACAGSPTSLFGLAPGGVYRAAECYHRRGALLPHPFTLTGPTCVGLRRFAFCCTFRGLTPPRCYLAPCPGSPDFPPRLRAAIAWPTPARMIQVCTQATL